MAGSPAIPAYERPCGTIRKVTAMPAPTSCANRVRHS